MFGGAFERRLRGVFSVGGFSTSPLRLVRASRRPRRAFLRLANRRGGFGRVRRATRLRRARLVAPTRGLRLFRPRETFVLRRHLFHRQRRANPALVRVGVLVRERHPSAGKSRARRRLGRPELSDFLGRRRGDQRRRARSRRLGDGRVRSKPGKRAGDARTSVVSVRGGIARVGIVGSGVGFRRGVGIVVGETTRVARGVVGGGDDERLGEHVRRFRRGDDGVRFAASHATRRRKIAALTVASWKILEAQRRDEGGAGRARRDARRGRWFGASRGVGGGGFVSFLDDGEAPQHLALIAGDAAEVVEEEEVAVGDAQTLARGDELLVVVRVEELIGGGFGEGGVVRAERAAHDAGVKRVEQLAQDDAVPQTLAETLEESEGGREGGKTVRRGARRRARAGGRARVGARRDARATGVASSVPRDARRHVASAPRRSARRADGRWCARSSG